MLKWELKVQRIALKDEEDKDWEKRCDG